MGRPRALVTGHNGFTGRYVAAELEVAGYDVVSLSGHADASGTGSVTVNLLDRVAVAAAVADVRPEVVLHLAAISFVAHDDVDEIYRVNVVGTHHLLDALVQLSRKPQIVVLASSANIYGNAEVEPITEDTPPAPANDYAVSKLAMEYMARLWMDRLPIVITRPFNYTGVGQSEQFLIPKIVSHFRRGEQVIALGNIRVARDFGDVRDVAKAYVAIIENRPAGEIFNICTGIGCSVEEMLGLMTDIAGYQIQVEINPAFVRANDISRLVGSNQRLKACSDWQVRHRLGQTLEWMYRNK